MMPDSNRSVVCGVDTHKNQHVAVVLDSTGQLLGESSFETNSSGYALLLDWCVTFGNIAAVGIEGSGSYGAGLNRYLTAKRVVVHEVMSPKRRTRRRHGKSDSIDAEAAARTVLSGHDLITPKSAGRAFSPSNSLSRFASLAFIPPYWASHRCHVDSAISRCRHTSSSSLPELRSLLPSASLRMI